MMMYPKPKKTKHKNKYSHISNKRITEYTPCYVCGSISTSNHEIYFGDSYRRNKSIEYNAQVKLCDKCHRKIHNGDGKLDQELKKAFQYKLMAENDWTVEEFRNKFKGKSYV